MDVSLIKENDDGSADYHVNMSNEEQAQLFRFAFLEMLKRGIQEGKQYEPTSEAVSSEVSVDDTGCGEPSCSYGPCVKSGKSEQPCYCSETTQIPY
jgi:hypothetical protein